MGKIMQPFRLSLVETLKVHLFDIVEVIGRRNNKRIQANRNFVKNKALKFKAFFCKIRKINTIICKSLICKFIIKLNQIIMNIALIVILVFGLFILLSSFFTVKTANGCSNRTLWKILKH
jgi:hypothetical protein